MDSKSRPMCGPAERVDTKGRPMCGPRPGSEMWRKMISNDIRSENLRKGREKRIIDKAMVKDIEKKTVIKKDKE